MSPRAPETMPSVSSESNQPLRKMSEILEIDIVPKRPDPIYTRTTHLTVDLEKQDCSQPPPNLTPGFTPTYPISSPSQPSTITSEWNCEYVPEQKPSYESHLGLILIYLSTAAPLVAGILSMYSIATILLMTLLAPLSLCFNRQSLSNSIISSLSPAIRLQLRTIYCAPISTNAESMNHMICSIILAPFYAIAIAFAAWVAAAFWGYAAILGEPNERAGEEQDGRAAIRAVRGMLERWLLWGLQ